MKGLNTVDWTHPTPRAEIYRNDEGDITRIVFPGGQLVRESRNSVLLAIGPKDGWLQDWVRFSITSRVVEDVGRSALEVESLGPVLQEKKDTDERDTV